MNGEPGTHDIQWQGIAITVTISRNWLNTGYDHLELRADQPLPVTTTGYRSHFIPPDQLHLFDDVSALVVQWLDDAAKSTVWIKAQEDRRQLKLF